MGKKEIFLMLASIATILTSTVNNNSIPVNKKDTAEVSILMYHDINSNVDTKAKIEPEIFEKQMQQIDDMGYETITFDDIEDFVTKGEELPEKSVVITFDDGYLSNYEIAYPILKEKNMKATIFVIGSSIGLDKYKDTEYEIIPHFNYEQAKEMVDSGLISIQSHTYDMHQEDEYETNEKGRTNVLKLENESIEDYKEYVNNDVNMIRKELTKMNMQLKVISYPHGQYDNLSIETFKENKIKIGVATGNANNILTKGDKDCLMKLKRIDVLNDTNIHVVL